MSRFKKYFICLGAAVLIMAGDSKSLAQVRADTTSQKKMPDMEGDFGKRIFIALQTNDVKLWLALHPTEEEYKSLLQEMLAAKVEGLTQEKIDEVMERRRREVVAAYTKQLADLRLEGTKAGIVWNKAIFEKFDSHAVYPEELHKKYLDGVLWFSSTGTPFTVSDIQGVETASGYKLQTIKGIRRVEEGE